MYNINMKNIINTSELQRKGLKGVYSTIEEYGEAFIINQRSNKTLRIIDNDNPHLLINIIKSLKGIKDSLKENFNVDQVGIFGSYSRGQNTPSSDLDIIVNLEYKDFKEMFALEDFLKKSLKIKQIDLVTFKNINAFAKETMKKDVIYV